jgi:rhomboid protease GluP
MPTVEVYRSPHSADCEQRALVLAAFSIPSDILFQEGYFLLLVEEERRAAAIAQLFGYEQEGRTAEPTPMSHDLHAHAGWGSAVYAVILVLIAYLAGDNFLQTNWTAHGALRGTLLQTGEWWRVVTSLTLHADVGHLLGNVLIGGAFGYFAGQLFGAGVAWLSILCAGALGGVLDGVLMPATHQTIGASGAVFAALGIVAAYAWRQRANPSMRWAQRWSPLIAAAAVLALLGSGGENTDVLAHLTGFVSGAVFGALYAHIPAARLRRSRLQLSAGASAILILLMAWLFALT